MWIAVVAAFALAGPPGNDFSVSTSRTEAPPGLTFRAGYAVHSSGTWIVEIYTRREGAESWQWAARRGLSTPGGLEQVTWTDSPSCHVLGDVAMSLNRLSLGSPWIPDTERRQPRLFVYPPPPPIATDAPSYSVWGVGIQGGGFADYRVDASSGAIADWAKAADLALVDCWRG